MASIVSYISIHFEGTNNRRKRKNQGLFEVWLGRALINQ